MSIQRTEWVDRSHISNYPVTVFATLKARFTRITGSYCIRARVCRVPKTKTKLKLFTFPGDHPLWFDFISSSGVLCKLCHIARGESFLLCGGGAGQWTDVSLNGILNLHEMYTLDLDMQQRFWTPLQGEQIVHVLCRSKSDPGALPTTDDHPWVND